MKRTIISGIIIFHAMIGIAQEFKIVRFDYSKYPELSVLYEASDALGNVITDAFFNDFAITENNKNRIPSELVNPINGFAPISVTLVLDNSGSMKGKRLDLAKKGIGIFLKSFPFETSELSLESFSDDAQVNTDFTQKAERVLFTLNTIEPLSGTNYNNAFLSGTTGAFDLSVRAINKKLIIFVTDGLSNVNTDEVTNKANALNIPVHCLLIDLHVPKDLKSISKSTGGSVVDNINNEIQLASGLSNIIQQAQLSRYGEIKWMAENNCTPKRKLGMVFRGIPVNTEYTVPDDKVARLEINPEHVSFGVVQPETEKVQEIELIPHNNQFNLTQLNVTKPDLFSYSVNALLSNSLLADSAYKIKVRYAAKDVVTESAILRISTKECPDYTIKLTAGTQEELHIVKPAGGEVFVPGMDTCIQWEGTAKNRQVGLWFRQSPLHEWKPIANSHNWNHKWTVGCDSCATCQLRLTTEPISVNALRALYVLQGQGFNIESVLFNNIGNYLMSNDDHGFVTIWNVLNGAKEMVYGGFKFESATFYNNNTLALFNKDKMTILSADNNQNAHSYSFANRKVFSALTFDDGTEQLISAYTLKDKTGRYRIWMPGTNHNFYIDDEIGTKSASFDSSGNTLVALNENNILASWNTKLQRVVSHINAPVWSTKVVLNPNGNNIIIVAPGHIAMFGLPNLQPIWERTGFDYLKFAQSGQLLIVKEKSGAYSFLNCQNGNTEYSFNDYTYFQASPSSLQLLHYANDTFRLFDISTKKTILQFTDAGIKACRFSSNGKRVLVVNGRNEIDLYNAENGTLEESLTGFESTVKSAVFNPNSDGLAVVLSNGTIQIFAKGKAGAGKETVSNAFTIISPKPVITDSVIFSKLAINESTDILVARFASNSTKFPIAITKIEIINDANSSFSCLQSQFPLVVNAFDSVACEFRFAPKLVGNHSAFIKTTTATDTFLAVIQGNAFLNPALVTTHQYNFGSVKLHSKADTIVSFIRNAGLDTLLIDNVDITGTDTFQFHLNENYNSRTLAPGSELFCNISFSPIYRGLASGTAFVTIYGQAKPLLIKLTGEGFAPRKMIVNGTIKNSSDSLPITTGLNCIDLLTNKVILFSKSDTFGQFKLTVNADRNYSVLAVKNNFLSSSENIDLSETVITDTLNITLWLTEVKNGGMIRFNCIFFEFAKATIKEISKSDLNRLVRMLADNPSVILEIHGHTDNVGGDAENMLLSFQRANAVKSYLVQKGISALRLKTIAYGERNPLSGNSTQDGRKMNRRVEFKIIGH